MIRIQSRSAKEGGKAPLHWRIAEMKTVDSSHPIRLGNDSYIPLGRSYRGALEARISGE